MVYCIQCGSSLEPNYKYCSRCGRPVDARPLLEAVEIISPQLLSRSPLAFQNEINKLFSMMNRMLPETFPRFPTLDSQTLQSSSGLVAGEMKGFFSYRFGGAPTNRPERPSRSFRIPVE